MSTRGTAYFELQESSGGDPVVVGRIGIPRDGYPSWFGLEVCKIISGVRIDGSFEGSAGDERNRRCFRNLEGVILDILHNIPSDYYFDDEYIYRFIFTRGKGEGSPYYVEDIARVEMQKKYGSENFSGTFDEFRAFCKN